MARTRHYKKIEKNLVSSFLHGLQHLCNGIGKIFVKIFRVCDSKLTIMIVPHSQSKVINFRTNVFALAFGIVLVAGIVSSFIYFKKQDSGIREELARSMKENRELLASFDELRDENNNVLQTAKRFRSSLSQTLSLLGINQSNTVAKAAMSDSDLNSLFDTQDTVAGSTKEASDMRQLSSYLESAIQPIEQIGKMLESQETLFADIPNIWPVRGGIGHVSQPFGQTTHPITGNWYIHKGLDISTWRSGDPILATANGQVVTVAYDSGFGNYVIIKHKHGIYTRYCHMASTRVKKGQFVSQRDVIGYIGSTGISTGPHLHYEVHIGSDVVDPAKYVNIKVAK
ncbi:M23 family metallopeptidase [uncultured Treponema sp.]|uniref:M23 family metallopeptidase n=1 Tax=uncultured Treponema sp. TaxID=162155 RepID=UPI0025E56A9A|nr:M23 family metallopeptidase [uncultured Treponema sp.]